jgi:hypothetical protein
MNSKIDLFITEIRNWPEFVAEVSLDAGLGDAAAGFVPQAPSDPSNPLVINQYGSPGPAPSTSLERIC